ncbi:MAG: phosphoglucosamine mutase [Elusimicrobia bacterium]|nr:phosphoglucosamine mutase [Elusimicrobiota bacterium]
MGKLFGTDGIRGIPGEFPLIPEFVFRLGYVTATLLRQQYPQYPPRVLLAQDTRGSGVWLGERLACGLAAAGLEVEPLGVVPTPAVSYWIGKRRALAGAMVSASHNPPEFNGIKFFGPHGDKISPLLENLIEERAQRTSPSPSLSTPVKLSPNSQVRLHYLRFLKSTVPALTDFDRLRIVLDCSNGAASAIGPALFAQLGARVYPIAVRPNGKNINVRCGALTPQHMQKKTKTKRAFAGIALDGDSDRAILSDEKGRLLNGDRILAMAAMDLKIQNRLSKNLVITTRMANLGLLRFFKKQGIESRVVPVGDRYIAQALNDSGAILGGESSGHIIFKAFSPTGDGLLTALQALSIARRWRKPLSFFQRLFSNTPQILRNIPADQKIPFEKLPRLQKSLARAKKRLGERGRVWLRYSGTEPVARLLVEGPDRAQIRKIAQEIEKMLRQEMTR